MRLGTARARAAARAKLPTRLGSAPWITRKFPTTANCRELMLLASDDLTKKGFNTRRITTTDEAIRYPPSPSLTSLSCARFDRNGVRLSAPVPTVYRRPVCHARTWLPRLSGAFSQEELSLRDWPGKPNSSRHGTERLSFRRNLLHATGPRRSPSSVHRVASANGPARRPRIKSGGNTSRSRMDGAYDRLRREPAPIP